MQKGVGTDVFEPSNDVKVKGVLYRRAKSKYVSDEIAQDLIRIKKSPLHDAYIRTMECSGTLLQEGKKITSTYCNGRWCITCNRMRTGKLINGYKEQLTRLPDLQFVTLTLRSVPWFSLGLTITRMGKQMRDIKKQLLKKGYPTNGVRKLEITYDDATGLYHPHYHLMISGKMNADMIVLYWMLAFPNETNRKAQDVRAFSGNEHNLVELFKYSTKMIASSTKKVEYQGRKSKVKTIAKTPAFALDRIFRALYMRRTFQAMGIVKNVSEDIEELQSQLYEELNFEEGLKVWKWGREWNEADWLSLDWECLTGFSPSESLQNLLINSS
jgi:hypothetical protein